MSHFSVLVIGPDPEAQLAPYHEYECTGLKDQYVVWVEPEETNDALQAQYQEKKEEHSYTSFPEFMDEYHGYGFNGETKTYGRWTNPNAKWDWYSIGGRWTGFFKLKDGGSGITGRPGVMTEAAEEGTADQLTKGDIDIEGMRMAAVIEARGTYDKLEEVTEGLSLPPRWSDLVEQAKATDDPGDALVAARETYHKHPYIKALNEVNLDPWGEDALDIYCLQTSDPRSAYLERAANGAMIPFAIVMEGKWHGRGDMGWFGMSTNDKPKDDWHAEISVLIDKLPDDTLFTLVDCHI